MIDKNLARTNFKMHLLAGCVLFLGGFLSIPGQILLPATGFPESLQGMGGSEAISLFLVNEFAFRVGYLSNAISALLVFFGMIYLAKVSYNKIPNLLSSKPLLGLAISSGALRSIWWFALLTQVPLMAKLWQEADSAGKAIINVNYILLNDLLSTIQEDLGVNILGGLFLILFSVSVFKNKVYPKWVAIMAGIAALSFIASSSEFLGIPGGSVLPFIGPTVSGFMFMGIGILEWLRARNVHTKLL
ncbi:MAG: hypothetical protein ACK5CM_20750 [Pseudanabaena sp.]|jgi:hypothetical protein